MPSSVPAPPLEPELVAWLAIAGAAVGVLGLVVGLVAQSRLRRVRRAVRGLRAEASTGGTAVGASGASPPVTAGAGGPQGSALRHVAVVRYDAFGDTGGRLSFSAALLDDAGDGLVLTSLQGRTEGRTYAKAVTAGGPAAHPLSPEEEQAVRQALGGTAPARRAG